MSTEEFHEKITELDKVEGVIKVCINSLYDQNTSKDGIAYILEMTNSKLSTVKADFDKITTLN
ncbi:hypothetical protein N5912_00705 [Arcobacter lacus]|uniref:hypothetical protein n=1 Tax=Arcobacter lacus TaxID=1912876 RepID=UPI0021BA875E|nr:hypothetical protein [Arcobacter lacus]MCT7910338.1 hypothetical protein [Arcobacter lacus]